jgi:hypothetical protein
MSQCIEHHEQPHFITNLPFVVAGEKCIKLQFSDASSSRLSSFGIADVITAIGLNPEICKPYHTDSYQHVNANMKLSQISLRSIALKKTKTNSW